MKQVLLAILILALTPSISEARKKRVRHVQQVEQSFGFFQEQKHPTTASTTVIPHPSGCPRRAFCGCGASIAVFGKPIRELFLAANWFKFPRTSPSSGMVAVRRHHVFVLRSPTSRGNWIVEDYNSGRGLSRIHERSLAGYTIVNPRG